jgi:hypothetical protein
MAFSKYYTQFQPRQRQRSNGEDLLEAMRKMQEQQQAEQQQNSQASMSDWQNAGKLGKSIFGSSAPTGATNFINSSGGISTAFQSPAATQFGGSSLTGAGGGMGAIQSPITGGATSNALGGMGGSGGSSALMSNPYGWAAAILASANVMHNKDISPWSETIKGQAGGNLVDYYQGRKDGKEHGFMSKLMDADGATGQATKGITDFLELDFSNAFGNTKDSLKSLFKGKLF